MWLHLKNIKLYKIINLKGENKAPELVSIWWSWGETAAEKPNQEKKEMQ